ncbi:MAG: hypothetical protein IJF17_01100 [Thermoguttaceae bacterium]|nr:hypothetical protein [Thermoguttaceae bacterium]
MKKLAILALAFALVWGLSSVFTSDVSAQRPGRIVRPAPARNVRPAPARPAPPQAKPAPPRHGHPAPPPPHHGHPAPPPPHHGHHHYHDYPDTWGELIGDVIDAAIRESRRP